MLSPNSKALIHPGSLFPYESSWLIFVNLLKWNRFNDYRHLREFLDPCFKRGRQRNSWEYGLDIPFERLESAMSLECGSLKYSFIDGWFPLPREHETRHPYCRPRILIRHCPECISAGYHSVIFYLERITHCPWHGHALERCDECTFALDQDWPTRRGIYKVADQCVHLKILLGLIAPNVLTSDFFAEVEVWIANFREWVAKSVELIGHSAHEVIATKEPTIMDVAIAIDYLVKKVGPPGFGHKRSREAFVLTLPRSKMSWLRLDDGRANRQLLEFEGLQPQIDLVEIRPIIKSLRRYIYKRYVRHHAKCYKRLRRLSNVQWFMLDGASICPCVLSYLLFVSKQWNTTPFGFCSTKLSLDTGACRERKKKNHSTTRSCFEHDVARMLGDFYTQWVTLRNYRKANSQCMPCVDRYSGRVWLSFSGIYRSGASWANGEYWDNHLFMEDPGLHLKGSQSPCRERLNRSLVANIETLKTPNFFGVENVVCVLYNLESKHSRTRDIDI